MKYRILKRVNSQKTEYKPQQSMRFFPGYKDLTYDRLGGGSCRVAGWVDSLETCENLIEISKQEREKFTITVEKDNV